MAVYIDVLIVVNGFVNYLLLLLTMKITGYKTVRLRLLFGALFGSIFSLKIFLPDFPFIFELFFRIIFAGIIVLISFSIRSFKGFLKGFASFFSVSFALSGVVIALIYLFNPPDLLYDNGVFYYNLSFVAIIILSTVSFFVLTLIEKLVSRKTDIQKIYEITLYNDNKKVTGRALLDTGNSLKDPFSGEGVIVADKNCIKSIMPENINDYFKNNYVDKIRIIPVSTVNGTGLLPIFKAEKIEIMGINKHLTKNDIYIAVSPQKFTHGEFEFLLYNNILEENTNDKNNRIYK